jgi:hypothetical protein
LLWDIGDGEFVFVWFVRLGCFFVEGCEKQIDNF